MTYSRITRYRGTSPFQDTRLHRKILFGRDAEKRSLLSLLLAEDLVVVFARSGMGKTSLINAGLLAPLRERGHFPIVARLNRSNQSFAEAVLDGVARAKAGWPVDQIGGTADDAWSFFDTVEFWSETSDLLTPVLVLDQFEELFTLRTPAERKEIRRQLRDLIRGRFAEGRGLRRPRLKVLLSLREDFLANLEELAAEIPGVLRNRFRLGPLTIEGARSAIVRTAETVDDEFETEPFVFAEDALDRIVSFLAEKRLGDRTIPTDEVEPVLLQLICQNVEVHVAEKVRARGDASGDGGARPVVTNEDLGPPGHLRKVLEGFYDRTLAAIRPRSMARRVRKLCERRLISASGRRLTEDEEEIARKFKIPRDQLSRLVAARLLRAEPRLGGTFYELSHDTLVAPIQQSQRRRRERALGAVALAMTGALVVGLAYFGGPTTSDILAAPGVRDVMFSPDVSPETTTAVLADFRAVLDGDDVLSRDSPGAAGTVESIQRLLVFLGYPTGENGTYEVSGELGVGTALGLAHFAVEDPITIPGEDRVRAALETDAAGLTRLVAGIRGPFGVGTAPTAADEHMVEELFRIDGDEVSRLLTVAAARIDSARVLMGDFQSALFHLNAITASRSLLARELAERYGEVAESVAAAEGVHADWLLAVVGAQTQGILSPRFDDDVYRLADALGFAGPDAPVGSAERRLRATAMTLGGLPGYTVLSDSMGSAEAMMFASAERQLSHIARTLMEDAEVGTYLVAAEPSAETFTLVAQAAGHDDSEWLSSWFYDVRDARSSSVSTITLNRMRATLVPGERVALIGTPIDSVGNELVGRQQTWMSSDASVAAVDDRGVVRGVGVGRSTVWAEIGGVRSAEVTVTVRSSEAALLAGYKVGVYFNDANARQRAAAQRIYDGLVRVGHGSVELYPRPASFFVAALRPEGYEIRYEDPREARQFEYLRNLLAVATPGVRYSGVTVFNQTPNFLSVFVPDLSILMDSLNAPQRTTRRSTLQSLIDGLGNDTPAIAEALSRLEGSRDSGPLGALSPQGLVNVLTFLGATEADAWTPELLDLATRTVQRLGAAGLGPDATTALNNLSMHVTAIRER